jgi:hypothetical protein
MGVGWGFRGERDLKTAIDTAPGLDQLLHPALVALLGCLKEQRPQICLPEIFLQAFMCAAERAELHELHDPQLVLSLNATDLLHFKRSDPGCAYVRPCVFF